MPEGKLISTGAWLKWYRIVISIPYHYNATEFAVQNAIREKIRESINE